MSPARHLLKSQPKQLGFLVLAITLFTTANAPSATAQDSAPSPFSTVASKLNPANWKMPSVPKPNFRLPTFLVPQSDQDRIVQRKNGLFDDMKATTASSWKRTKEIFNPARLNPMNLLAGPATSPSEPKSPGFFSSMFGAPSTTEAAEPTERVATVNQFLSQDRP